MVINTRTTTTNRLASVITKPTEMIGLIAASTRPIMSPTSEVAIGAYQVALATGPFSAIITAFPRVTSCPSARGGPRVCPHMCAQLDSLWRMLAGLFFFFLNSQRYRPLLMFHRAVPARDFRGTVSFLVAERQRRITIRSDSWLRQGFRKEEACSQRCDSSWARILHYYTSFFLNLTIEIL